MALGALFSFIRASGSPGTSCLPVSPPSPPALRFWPLFQHVPLSFFLSRLLVKSDALFSFSSWSTGLRPRHSRFVSGPSSAPFCLSVCLSPCVSPEVWRAGPPTVFPAGRDMRPVCCGNHTLAWAVVPGSREPAETSFPSRVALLLWARPLQPRQLRRTPRSVGRTQAQAGRCLTCQECRLLPALLCIFLRGFPPPPTLAICKETTRDDTHVVVVGHLPDLFPLKQLNRFCVPRCV